MSGYVYTDLNDSTKRVLQKGNAQGQQEVDLAAFIPLGAHTSDNALSSAKTLTPPAGATKLLIQAFDQNIRFTLSGTDPTASTGFRLTAGNPPVLIQTTGTVKVIQETSGAAIQYQWGK